MPTTNNEVSVRSPWAWRFWLVACLVLFWFGIQQPSNRGLYFSGAVICAIIAARRKP